MVNRKTYVNHSNQKKKMSSSIYSAALPNNCSVGNKKNPSLKEPKPPPSLPRATPPSLNNAWNISSGTKETKKQDENRDDVKVKANSTTCSMKDIILEQQRQKEEESRKQQQKNSTVSSPPRSSLQAALLSSSPSKYDNDYSNNNTPKKQQHSNNNKHCHNSRQRYNQRPTASSSTRGGGGHGFRRNNNANQSHHQRGKAKGRQRYFYHGNAAHQRSRSASSLSTSSTCSASSSSSNSSQSSEVDDTTRSKYISLDCEMVGVGPNGLRSALARICILNYSSQILLDTFVKVSEPITDYRTSVSGIRKENIEAGNAMDYIQCQDLVKRLLKGKILVGHALENDLCVLGIHHPWEDIRDTSRYAPYMTTSSISLSSSSSGGGGCSSTPRCSISSFCCGGCGGTCMEIEDGNNNKSKRSAETDVRGGSGSDSTAPSVVESDCSSSTSSLSSSSSSVDTSLFSTSPTSSHLSHPPHQSSHYHYSRLRPRKLKDLAKEKLGLEIQKDGYEHNPIEDANAALGLYKLVREDWERCMLECKGF